MNMEEIVALSVKHNVSDLHLCNAWPARWRRHGKVESAPFTAPDVENLLMCWLSEQQQVQLQEQGQIDFAVTLTDSRRLRASICPSAGNLAGAKTATAGLSPFRRSSASRGHT